MIFEILSNVVLYTVLTVISETCGYLRYAYSDLYTVFYGIKVSVDVVREIQKVFIVSK